MSWTQAVVGGCGIAVLLNAFLPGLVLKPLTRTPEAYHVISHQPVKMVGNRLFFSAQFSLTEGCRRRRFEALVISGNNFSDPVQFDDLDGRADDDARTPGLHTLDHVYLIPDQVVVSETPVGAPRFLELTTEHICGGKVSPKTFARIDLRDMRVIEVGA